MNTQLRRKAVGRDSLLIWLLLIVLIFWKIIPAERVDARFAYFGIYIVCSYLYIVVSFLVFGATLGMAIIRMKLVSTVERRLNLSQVLGYALKYFSKVWLVVLNFGKPGMQGYMGSDNLDIEQRFGVDWILTSNNPDSGQKKDNLLD